MNPTTEKPIEPAPRPQVMVASMCGTHRYLLVTQTDFSRDDPWMALEITASIVLFQGASCDPKVRAETGGDVEKIGKLGCLACRKPDLFGEIIQAAQAAGKDRALGAIKTLGEHWVEAASKEKKQ